MVDDVSENQGKQAIVTDGDFDGLYPLKPEKKIIFCINSAFSLNMKGILPSVFLPFLLTKPSFRVKIPLNVMIYVKKTVVE